MGGYSSSIKADPKIYIFINALRACLHQDPLPRSNALHYQRKLDAQVELRRPKTDAPPPVSP